MVARNFRLGRSNEITLPGLIAPSQLLGQNKFLAGATRVARSRRPPVPEGAADKGCCKLGKTISSLSYATCPPTIRRVAGSALGKHLQRSWLVTLQRNQSASGRPDAFKVGICRDCWEADREKSTSPLLTSCWSRFFIARISFASEPADEMIDVLGAL